MLTLTKWRLKIAASMALKNAVSKCNPVLLEPMMKVEVVIPEEYMGDIMGDITSRRGRVEGMEARGNAQVVRAMVPLSEMFDMQLHSVLTHKDAVLSLCTWITTKKCLRASVKKSSKNKGE